MMRQLASSNKIVSGIAVVVLASAIGFSTQFATAQMPGVDPLLAELMSEGETFYQSNCATCHGDEGEGGIGPALAASERMSSIGTIVRQILFGGERMPAMSQFSDRQIAGVATYIRNSLGNDHGIVTEEEAASWR